MTDLAAVDGFERHNSELSITSLKFVGAQGEPAVIWCNLGESRLFHAGKGRRRRSIGRRPG